MKNQRIIKGNFEFQNIISKQQFIKNASFVIYYDVSTKGFLEYGISVGKKIGNAVIRNKIKRQIRMMINQNIDKVKMKPFKIVVIARQAMLDRDFEKNNTAFIKLLEELK